MQVHQVFMENPIRIPIKESDEKNPINPYAETKTEKGRIGN